MASGRGFATVLPVEAFARRVLALLILLWLAPILCAANARFIILIDPSAKMDARREAIMRTVGDLARTGFHERIKDGDILTIHAGGFGAPLLEGTWNSDDALAWRDKAVTVAGALPYLSASGQTGGMRIQSTEESVSLFILTDGFHRLGGTGYDQEINAALESSRDSFEKAAKPMLVTILADQGQWVAWSAHTNLGAPITLPDLPPRQVARKETSPAVVVQEKPREPEPEPIPAPAATPTPIETPKPAESAAIAEPVKSEPAAIAIQQPDPEPAPKIELAAATPAQEIVDAEPPPAARPEPKTAPIVAAVVPPAAPKRPSFPWLPLAFALAIVGLGGVAAYKRLTRPPPVANSLISRSLNGRSGPRQNL